MESTEKNQVLLKRSVLIGIGGTGRDSVLYAKKRIIEIYDPENKQKAPDLFNFLVIDTEAPKSDSSKIKLDGSEFVYADVRNVQSLLEHNQHIKDLIPEKILEKATNLTAGAGQIRGLGRIALLAHYQSIKSLIKKAIDDVRAWKTDDHYNNYKALDNSINIHLVFSTSGGTGSGMFIDVANIIRQSLNQSDRIFAYILMPDVFESLVGTQNVGPNCYGAFKELDYLMNIGESTKFHVNYGNGEIVEFNKAPFDHVYLINNTNTDGLVYDDIKDLTQFIGNALYLQAGSIGKDAQSAWDNISKQISHSTIGSKSQIYLSFGISELFYDGEKLSDLACRKMSHKLIEKYINISGTSDITEDANIFIINNNLKEDDNQDDVIDSLLPIRNFPPEEPKQYNDNTSREIDGIKEAYISRINSISDDTLNDNYTRFSSQKNEKLNEVINNKLREEGGIDYCKRFLQALNGKLNAYKKLLEDESNDIRINRNELEKRLSDAKKELEETAKGVWPFGKEVKIKNKCSICLNHLKSIGKSIQELKRRQEGARFYSQLIELVDLREKEIMRLELTISKINKELIQEIEEMKTTRHTSKPFMIHLSNDLMDRISDGNVVWSDFIKYIKENSVPIYEWGNSSLSTNDIKKLFLSFTKETDYPKSFRNSNIEEQFEQLSDHKKDAIIESLNNKAVPLWQYDAGIVPNTTEMFIIGVPDITDSKIKPYLDKVQSENKIIYSTTNDKSRILFFKTEISCPAFAINSFKKYKTDYDTRNQSAKENRASSISFHINPEWEEKFEDLFPPDKQDKLELWTKANALKLIKFEKGEYRILKMNQFKEEVYIVFCDDTSKTARRSAYDIFARLPEVDEFISQKVDNVSAEETKKMYEDHYNFLKGVITSNDFDNEPKVVRDLLNKEALIMDKQRESISKKF